ncbi:MAG: M23 family peptidase [Chloroflexi bacterium]|nr:MAG: M23 family peptidase [Chloroflexota bacterium]MBL1193824.1 M23 family metallopeptidase [Chloroflexota bacterium]NOH11118.1 M23 family metallopeptidase [Chloroflexota bacterium]
MVDKNTRDNETSENITSFALVMAQVRQLGLENPTLRVAVPVALVVLITLVVIVMCLFVGNLEASNQEHLLATAQAIAAPTLGVQSDTDSLPFVELPTYIVPDTPWENGIPRLADMDTIIPSRPRVDVLTYIVEQGDNIFAIADKFGLRPETILWGNFAVLADDPRYISPGDELNILPVDGVYRQYNIGESLGNIAAQLNTSLEAILEWPGNGLDPYETDPEKPNIADGSWLIVPGGSREIPDWGPPAITRDNPAVAAYYGPGACGAISEGAIGTGTFVWPTTQTGLSGFDWNPPLHNGIDIGGVEGNAIYATDAGVVVYSGESTFGFGLLIVIDHGNGFQSAYAHLSSVGTLCGQSVSQGQIIGGLGNTGNSTGPHLHFEIVQNGAKVSPWWFVAP